METIINKDGLSTVTLEVALGLVTQAAKSEAAYEAAVTAFKSAPVDFAYYKKLRSAFIAAKREASKCTADAAAKSWERLCTKCNYKAPKSESEAAKAKRAQRAKKGQTDKVSSSPEETAAPAKGAKRAEEINMKLSPIEANIIKWLRSRQWAMLNSAIKAQMDMAAPV